MVVEIEMEVMNSISITLDKILPVCKKVRFQEDTIFSVPKLTRQEIAGIIGLDNWSYYSTERYFTHPGYKFEMSFVLDELLEDVERYDQAPFGQC